MAAEVESHIFGGTPLIQTPVHSNPLLFRKYVFGKFGTRHECRLSKAVLLFCIKCKVASFIRCRNKQGESHKFWGAPQEQPLPNLSLKLFLSAYFSNPSCVPHSKLLATTVAENN